MARPVMHLLTSIFLVVGFCVVIVVGLPSALHDLLIKGFFNPPIELIEAPGSYPDRAMSSEESILKEL
jgi:hypothetical protein